MYRENMKMIQFYSHILIYGSWMLFCTDIAVALNPKSNLPLEHRLERYVGSTLGILQPVLKFLVACSSHEKHDAFHPCALAWRGPSSCRDPPSA